MKTDIEVEADQTKVDFTDVSFHWWLDWSSWEFGFRVDWQTWHRYFVVEIGPVGFSIEVGDDFVEDDAHA